MATEKYVTHDELQETINPLRRSIDDLKTKQDDTNRYMKSMDRGIREQNSLMRDFLKSIGYVEGKVDAIDDKVDDLEDDIRKIPEVQSNTISTNAPENEAKNGRIHQFGLFVGAIIIGIISHFLGAK